MQAQFIKGTSEDRIVIRGAGHATAELRFPKKGVIPHDAVHLVVEQELRMETGFWGQIAAGTDPVDGRPHPRTIPGARARRATPRGPTPCR